jgi:dihydroflavonol-4-reductase
VLPDRDFWNGRRVCVTGGTGFLGWQIVSLLRDLGAEIRVLALEPEWSHPIHRSPALTAIWGDVRDPTNVRRALEGCSVVFHTAGVVGVWGAAMERMWSVHVEGTGNVLTAAPRDARIVHTSSLTTIGASSSGEVLNEDAPPRFQKSNLGYVLAKRAAEALALRSAGDGHQVTITNPGYLVVPEDYEQSIMGRFGVRDWKGRVPMSPPGGLNLVDVRDAANGHLLAAEHGQCGRRYSLGGENHRFPSLLKTLANVANCTV